jgi:putative membrane protein
MKMTLKTLMLGLIAGTFFFSCKKNDNNNTETLSAQYQTFIDQAFASNTAEIRIGGMADSTADSSAIRAFGRQLMGEYQAAQNDLKSLGQTVKFNVSDSLDSAHMLMIDTLMGLTGRAFDSVFILRQIQDHNAAIANYQNEINSGNRSQVVQYANKFLPGLQMHLNTADSLATAMGFK